MYEALIKRLRELQAITEHCDEHSCFECENRELCDKHDNKTVSGTYKEAADAIEELSRLHEAQRQNLITLMNEEPEPEWIPVTERLPEQEKQILVTGIEAIGNVRIYDVKQLDGDVWRPTSAPSCYWKHWMPLPEPPKEEVSSDID